MSSSRAHVPRQMGRVWSPPRKMLRRTMLVAAAAALCLAAVVRAFSQLSVTQRTR